MKKRFFSILLSLCMVLMLCPVTVFAANGDATALQALLEAGGTVTLTKDYSIDTTLRVNNTVTLDLNGHVIKIADSNSVQVIKIDSGGSLTLQDSQPSATHTDTSLPAGGMITGGKAKHGSISEAHGGGVYNDGSFTMNGGVITGCNADGNGGGVLNHGSFIMNGGAITGCSAKNGGGVYNYGSITMNGGAITGCSATKGGGIYNDNNSNIPMMIANGGEIEGLYNNAPPLTIRKENDASGTTFSGDVKNYAGMIDAGIYMGTVTNDKKYYFDNGGTISGGIFEGVVTNQNGAVISGGTFKGTVTNNTGSTISGGMFYGGINNNGTISNSTVTFKKDGIEYAQEVVSGDSKVVEPIEPTQDGYTFTGWYTDIDCTQQYAFGNTLSENITLYAGFGPVTYTVTYNGGEGSNPVTDVKTHGEALTLRGETFTMDGFVQTGWVDGQGAVYALGSAYTVDQDVTLNPVFEKLVTVTAPFTTTVALGDAGEPGETTFRLGLFDGTGNKLTYDDQYFFAEITTDGAGSYSGVMTITATDEWLKHMLYEGAFIWQYDGEEDDWTYDDTVWGVRLYRPEVAARSADAVQYSLLLYPTYVMSNGSFNLDLNAGPVEKMTFTNTYTAHDYALKHDATHHWDECACKDVQNKEFHKYGDWKVTKEATQTAKGEKEHTCTICGYTETVEIAKLPATTEPTNPDTDTKPDTKPGKDNPATGDNSHMALWIALLLVSGAGVIGTTVYGRKKRAK